MKNTIWLNNNEYGLQESVEKLLEDLPDWERDIFSFLVDWFSDSDTIQVQTSGSTGTPKLILIRKSAMRNSARMTGEFFEFSESNSALLCLPATYIAGKMMLVRAIEWGLKLDYIEPKITLQTLTRSYYFSAMTPQQVEGNLRYLSKIENLIIGGAPISVSLEKMISELKTSCFATYGMTETVSHIAIRKIGGDNQTYKVLPRIEIGTDTRNCLTISAPNLLDTTIVTNDIVTLKSDMEFTWEGRFDNIINSGGVKISPESVEQKMANLLNQSFFIAGISHHKWGAQVSLIIEGNNENTNTLLSVLKTVLTKLEIPKSIHYIPHFIRTENGKLNRKKTLELIQETSL